MGWFARNADELKVVKSPREGSRVIKDRAALEYPPGPGHWMPPELLISLLSSMSIRVNPRSTTPPLRGDLASPLAYARGSLLLLRVAPPTPSPLSFLYPLAPRP